MLTSSRSLSHTHAMGQKAIQATPAAEQVNLVLVVAVALIDSQGRVLLAQRPLGKSMAGLWEFPGGKVESGETPEAALVRELQEELGITVAASDLLPLTFASHTYKPSFHLLMPLYECRRWVGDLKGAEGQQLAWVEAGQLASYEMPAADIPLVPHIVRALTQPTAVSAA